MNLRHIVTRYLESHSYNKVALDYNENLDETIKEAESRFTGSKLADEFKDPLVRDIERLKTTVVDEPVDPIEPPVETIPFYWNSTIPALRSLASTMIVLGMIDGGEDFGKAIESFVKSWDKFSDKNNRIKTNMTVPEGLYLLYRIYNDLYFESIRIEKIANTLFIFPKLKNSGSMKAIFNEFEKRLTDQNLFNDYLEKKLLRVKKLADYYDQQLKR